MVVQHNLRAMNSNRMLGLTANVQSKSTEKLSSGYKINRAADDAAGLSISEKMRKQIRGLSQASLNAADGISAVQTAEGALNEVQDMLQRMNELAVKAANGTMSEDDRGYIQDEIDQLVTEINRVAETTKFNETYLLKGDAPTTKLTADKNLTLNGVAVTLNSGDKVENGQKILLGTVKESATKEAVKADNSAGAALSVTGTPTADNGVYTYKAKEATYAAASGKELYKIVHTKDGGGTSSYAYTKLTDPTEIKAAYDDITDGTYNNSAPSNGASATYYGYVTAGATVSDGATADTDVTDIASATNVGDGITETVTVAAGWYKEGETTATDLSAKGLTISNAGAGDTITVQNKKELEAADGVTGTYTGDISTLEVGDKVYGYATVTENTDGTKTVGISATKPTSIDPLVLKLHVGADSTDDNQITISINSMSADALSLLDADGKLLVNGDDDTNARAAIDTIAEALQQVSTQRSALGAVQNRLEHTIANLDNVVENTTAAESQIRDTDMATEMVKYSNNNILAQAGQAMLAQANQANQGVLSLLG